MRDAANPKAMVISSASVPLYGTTSLHHHDFGAFRNLPIRAAINTLLKRLRLCKFIQIHTRNLHRNA
jgi:hypothetical protein